MSLVIADAPPPALPRRRQLLFGTGFAGVAAAMYIFTLLGWYLQARADNRATWLAEHQPPLTQPNMQLMTLVMGMVTVQWAAWAIARNARGQTYLAAGITLLFAAAFLNQTTFLWVRVGLPVKSPEGPLFYALTGGHAAMVLAAAIMLALTTFRALGGQYGAKLPDGISASALLWHIVTALYMVVWYAVYIVK